MKLCQLFKATIWG